MTTKQLKIISPPTRKDQPDPLKKSDGNRSEKKIQVNLWITVNEAREYRVCAARDCKSFSSLATAAISSLIEHHGRI